MPNKKRLYELDLAEVGAERAAARNALDQLKGGAPVEAQVAFLKELIKNRTEAGRFQEDPKEYLLRHGMLLDPDVISIVNNAALFDIVIDPEIAAKLGEHSLKDVSDIRRLLTGGDSTTANVVAAAAVVAAVAAVVTMVVTLVRAGRQSDLVRLSGSGPDGITLPGGQKFVAREVPMHGDQFREDLSALPAWRSR